MIQKLQKPAFVYMNGRLTPWDEARLHVAAEAVIRCSSVFEGMKGFWQDDGRHFRVRAAREHYARLCRSAHLLKLPFAMSYEAFEEAYSTLVRELAVEGKDLWFRPTLFAVEGNWGEGNVTDLIITAYTQEQERPDSVDIGVSTWQRPGDASQSARIKASANYQVGRLARIDGRAQGFSDMVLLNQWGRVAEASASCIVMERGGSLITPPATEGCLESITVNIVARICETLGIPCLFRPVDRTELYIADSLALVGTVMGITPVRRIEATVLPERSEVLDAVIEAYGECMRGVRQVPGVNFTEVTGLRVLKK